MTHHDAGKVFHCITFGALALLSASVMAGLNFVPQSTAGLAAVGVATQGLSFSSEIILGFAASENVALQPLATDRTAIAKLDFKGASPAALTWSVMPSGIRVTDQQGHAQHIATLTSREVRPQVVVDAPRAAVWLYGKELYRYHTESGALVRYRLPQHDMGTINAVVVDAVGVWLATAGGAYVFDAVREQFNVVNHLQLSDQRLVKAAVADGTTWFIPPPSRLVRVARTASGAVQVTASQRLPLGVAAEMLVVRNQLWLLTSRGHGDHYELALVNPSRGSLQRLAGRYFSLREHQGRLLATAPNLLYSIDPLAKTITTARLDPARALAQLTQAGQVLFVGSSYGVKDNCEVVEHRRVDISKGWLSPGLDLYAPVRTAAAPITN